VWPVSRRCLLLRSTWSYLCIYRRSVLPYTRFCNCLLNYDCVLHIGNFPILYLNLWSISLVQAYYPIYTIHIRQEYQCSALRCGCDIRYWSSWYLVLRTCYFRVSFVVVKYEAGLSLSRPGNIVVGPAKNGFLLLFHMCRRDMYQHFLMSNVVKDWLLILMFCWLSYFCSKDMLSEFAYMLAGHNTSTVNVTFLPFHCCRTWCQVLWKYPNSTCTYKMRQYMQFISNRKVCCKH
jgi:hypothetical protein